MKITYYGHSTIALEVKGTKVLIDPFITGNPHCDGVVQAADLSPDVILLTHAHGDHWGDTESIVAACSPLVVANHEIVTYLSEKTGHEKVQGMNLGGSFDMPWGRVTQTLARHSSSFPDGTYGGHPNGYLIESGDDVVYVAGDTAPFAEMAWLGEEYDIDLAFLPIGDVYTMGISGAVRCAKMLRPAVTVPVHFDTFPPIKVDVSQWEARMIDAGMRAQVMAPGETLSL
ncbi:MAG: metal-dependent hydrolase [Rhodothermales bacterium]|nr:metal-dependent hydrolase [Rhodothermales bacterium]